MGRDQTVCWTATHHWFRHSKLLTLVVNMVVVGLLVVLLMLIVWMGEMSMLQGGKAKEGRLLFRFGEQCRVRRPQVLEMMLVAGPQGLDDRGNEVVGLGCWVVH